MTASNLLLLVLIGGTLAGCTSGRSAFRTAAPECEAKVLSDTPEDMRPFRLPPTVLGGTMAYPLPGQFDENSFVAKVATICPGGYTIFRPCDNSAGVWLYQCFTDSGNR
jgi:hypothetical protein